MKSIIYTVLIITTLMISSANACLCANHYSFATCSGDIAFTGKLQPSESDSRDRVFDVTKMLIGPKDQKQLEVDYWRGTSCSSNVLDDQEYIITAYQLNNGKYYIDLCTFASNEEAYIDYFSKFYTKTPTAIFNNYHTCRAWLNLYMFTHDHAHILEIENKESAESIDTRSLIPNY